jgi:hypothetical protein
MRYRLYKNAVVKAKPVEQRKIGFERCVIWRVTARLGIRKARGRTKYVAVTVTSALRQHAAHWGVIPASLAASRILS